MTERSRRPADLLSILFSGTALALLVAVTHALPAGSSQFTGDVIRVAGRIPRPIVFIVAALAALGTLAMLGALVARLSREDHRDGLNAIAGGVATVLVMIGAVAAWHKAPGPVAHAMLHGTDGSAMVRDAALVAAVTASGTLRRAGWTRWAVISLGLLILSGVGLAQITGLGAVTASLSGWVGGLLVRWLFGTSVRRPSLGALIAAITEGGVEVARLERCPGDAARLEGVDQGGEPLAVTAIGSEARGGRVLRRFWSLLRLRGAATGYEPLGVWSQLQTQALANVLAAESRVAAPRTLLLRHVAPDTIVLVERPHDGPSLGSETSSSDAVGLFAALRGLHQAGIAHRDLRAENLVCDGSESGFRSLEHATVAAGELVRRIDVAQLLTTVSSALGAGIAVEALHKGYRPVDERRVAAILQPVALIGWGWREARAARGSLSAVRRELIAREPGTSSDDLHLERLERFRWRTVATVIALTVAAYVLVGQLSKVNLIGALSHANFAWFAVALGGSAVTYVGSSLNLVAFVPKRVSVWKGSIVELSGAFIGLVTPPTVGHVAVNARFLHRQGVDTATTGGAVAVSQIVNFIVTMALLVVTVLITGTGAGHLDIVPSSRVLYLLGGLAAVIGAVFAIPKTRAAVLAKIWPPIRQAIPRLLEVLSQPLRLVMGVGGDLLLTGGYVLALVASLEAVGAHPPIVATAAVYMAGNAVGTAAPTPGGIGAVEAVLAAGLTAVGIPAHDAVPAVLIFRVATFWLPILPGWLMFLVLQRVGIL